MGKSRVASLILVAGIVLTLLSTFQSWRHAARGEVDRFETVSSFLIGRIETRAQFYLKLLTQTQGFFNSQRNVDKKKFQIFMENVDPLRNYPGLVEMGVIKVGRSNTFSVRYFDVFGRSGPDIDLPQILNEEEVHQAVKVAQMTGQPVLTGKIQLGGKDIDTNYTENSGFVALVPLKRGKGALIASPNEYLFAIVQSERFFRAVWEREIINRDVVVTVFDHQNANQAKTLFQSGMTSQRSLWDPEFLIEKTIQVGNQTWVVSATGTPAFLHSRNVFVPAVIFIFGILLSWLVYQILTSHYKYSDQVKKNEQHLELILNSVPALMAYIDRNHRLVFSNEVFKQWYGLEGIRDGQLRMEDFISKDEVALFGKALARALRGESLNFETKVGLNGQSRFLQINFKPDFNDADQVAGVVVMGIDLTDLRQAEQEIIAARNQAVEASKAKTNFLANMSHEIRTPLGAILGFTDLALSAGEEQDRLACLAKIKRNGKHLANLIDDLLDISKIEAGKLIVEKERFEIVGLVADVHSLLGPQARNRLLTLNFEAVTGIPKTILSDRMRLKQILVNIIGNAIKFSEKSEIKISLSTLEENGKTLLAIDVKDRGVGISQAQVHKLFKPFSQADSSTSRKFGGTGLGLALSKKLALGLGGDLCLLESTAGSGSTFRLTIDPGESSPQEMIFDLGFEELFEPTKVQAQASFPTNATPLKGISILLVEDSEDNQILISRYLKKAGGTVEFANNGREGVEKARAGNFDVILMDIQMPEVDGYEATRQLRKMQYQKPILALTAHAFKEERVRCLNAGCNDHFVKPIDPKALIQGVLSYSEVARKQIIQDTSLS